MRLKPFALLFLAPLLLAAEGDGCTDPTAEAARQAKRRNVAARQTMEARAEAQVKAYVPKHFPQRAAMARFLRETEDDTQLWYVYERSLMTGKIIAVWVSSIFPVATCKYMTPPEQISRHQYGTAKLRTMGLSGLYSGGAGRCKEFIFDETTGAVVILDADAIAHTTNVPLDIDVPRLRFKQ